MTSFQKSGAFASAARTAKGRKKHDQQPRGSSRTERTQPSSRTSGGGSRKSSKSSELPSNFYERLGVKKDATDKEIRKAYRKLAVKVCDIVLYLVLLLTSLMSVPPGQKPGQQRRK